MTNHDYKQHAYYMIYLIRCVLNGQIPQKEKLDKMDLPKLYDVAEKHSLSAITAYALESAEVVDERFEQAKAKAIRKNILLDLERERVFAEFEKAGVWYMPLKGIILKELYPKIGMMQMADNDILIDASKADIVRMIMKKSGFETIRYNKSNHDEYHKKPVSNFEIHRSLFESWTGEKTSIYYRNVNKRLLGNGNKRHFSDDDFYVYIIAHEYKHFVLSGTGLRSLVDRYLILKNIGSSLNIIYVKNELSKIGIAEYEFETKKMISHLFSGKKLSEKEASLLDCYIFAGTYGSEISRVRKEFINKDADILSKIRATPHNLRHSQKYDIIEL